MKTLLTISVVEDDDGNLVGETSGRIGKDDGTVKLENLVIIFATMMNTANACINAVLDNIETERPGSKRLLLEAIQTTMQLIREHPSTLDETRIASRWK